jgi:hypothetical protein
MIFAYLYLLVLSLTEESIEIIYDYILILEYYCKILSLESIVQSQ